MAGLSDWKALGRETWRDLDRRGIHSLWNVEFRDARRSLLGARADAIEKEPSGAKRVFRTASGLLFGLVGRLSPARRAAFVLALLLVVIGIPGLNGSGGRQIDLLLAFLLVSLLLCLELVDKLRFRDELELARELQATLLPQKPPEYPGFELATFNRIANTVGGDLYDFGRLPDGRLACLFGDASGHGMAAGLLMAVAEAAYRTQLDVDPSPDAVVGALNRILARAGGPRSFFSAAYVVLSPDGSFEAVLAGHPPLRRLSAAGAVVERIGRGAYPLGIRPELRWELETGRLGPGETLLFVSDGLVEARSRLGVELGDEVVERLVSSAPRRPQPLVEHLVRELDAFLGDEPAEDDVSILAIRRDG